MKGIKMFIGALAAASLLFSMNANAQENANRDENGKIVRGAYETNKAFDNTFIGIGAGWNAGIYGRGKQFLGMDLQGLGGLALDAYVGKWWTPAIGARIGYKGVGNFLNGKKAALAPSDWNQHYAHADFMWNITNSLFGYKETRFWNVAPYFTTGVMTFKNNTVAKPKWDLEYAAGFGLYNMFRLGNRVNLTLDFMGLVAYARQYKTGSFQHGRFHFPLSATIGLAFNLGKTNFDRHTSITPVVIPVPFTTEQYNALADKVAALEKENAQLKDKIAALEKELAPYKNLVNGQTYLFENGKFTAVDVTSATPLSIYFDLGSSKISAREKAHLEYFCEKAVDASTKLAVNGYADKQTGSAKTNMKLSENRVKAVVDLLKKAGASEANIETSAHGDTINPFDGAAKNRVVTIEVK